MTRRLASRFDPYDVAEQGERIARARIGSAAGFEDLAAFTVMVYTDEELDDLDVPADERNWVGQYSRGSIDKPGGATVLVNASSHAKLEELDDPVASLADTICHEVGHALWELLDDEARELWSEDLADHRWAPKRPSPTTSCTMWAGVEVS